MTAGNPDSSRVLISHLGSNGGGPKFTYHLFRALDRHEDLSAHYLIAAGADNADEYAKHHCPGILVPTYTTKMGLVLGLPRLILSALRVRTFIKKHSISVVVNAMESIYQGIVAPIAIPAGVKYISCVHDAQDHPGDEHLIKRMSRWGERLRADEFVVFSSAVRDAVSKKDILRGRPLRETVHGVFGADHPLPVRTYERNSDSILTVGFLGRLSKYKGLSVLNDAVGILRRRGTKVSAWIYGDGPESVLAESGDGANMSWVVGWIRDEDIPDILDSFDILVLPYTEASQSGVIAYALARGLPAVVTPVGGLAEQISRADSGLVARSTSPDDVADAIEALANNPELRMKFAKNALLASGSTYSWERVAEDFAGWVRTGAPMSRN